MEILIEKGKKFLCKLSPQTHKIMSLVLCAVMTESSEKYLLSKFQVKRDSFCWLKSRLSVASFVTRHKTTDKLTPFFKNIFVHSALVSCIHKSFINVSQQILIYLTECWVSDVFMTSWVNVQMAAFLTTPLSLTQFHERHPRATLTLLTLFTFKRFNQTDNKTRNGTKVVEFYLFCAFTSFKNHFRS